MKLKEPKRINLEKRRKIKQKSKDGKKTKGKQTGLG